MSVIDNIHSNYSDTDSDIDAESPGTSITQLKGYLCKWTNYIHGWQPRYIVLKDGTLSYYKSEQDSDFGCRGAISLDKATIKGHEFDDCRFDISVSNCVWYLRADTPEDKTHWMELLLSYKSNAFVNTDSLQRHGSTGSLQSNTFSTTSGASLKRTQVTLREKYKELETYKDILFGQVEKLQQYFDACTANHRAFPINVVDGLNIIDFKGESITFKETTAAVLVTMQHCLEIMNQRDDILKRKIDKEIERRKMFEELYKKYRDLTNISNSSFPGPDLEEGPHSTLPEDEFFDALESGLDKIEEDRQLRARFKLQSTLSHYSLESSGAESVDKLDKLPVIEVDEFGTGGIACKHKLWKEIEDICKEQLQYSLQGIGDANSGGWQLFADEGEMKMYRREQEIDGMVVDPLKACHIVQGCTAREMCHFFFMPDYRNDWETTLEDMTILEHISADTLIFLQTYKRIWPASQRDALFWSHMKHVKDSNITDENFHDMWIVCNHSTEYVNYPANVGSCVRIFLTVILVCQTFIEPQINKDIPISRKDLTCKITYCSEVNPGGWAPASVLRAVYKREYPKFLKRFTQYVLDQCKNQPIMF